MSTVAGETGASGENLRKHGCTMQTRSGSVLHGFEPSQSRAKNIFA